MNLSHGPIMRKDIIKKTIMDESTKFISRVSRTKAYFHRENHIMCKVKLSSMGFTEWKD